MPFRIVILWKFHIRGSKFTLHRGTADVAIYERLDWCLVSLSWFKNFPKALEIHVVEIASDHLPL